MMKRFFPSILAFFLSLISPFLLQAQDDSKTVQVSTVKKEGKSYFFATNSDPLAPYHIKFEFTVMTNFKFSAPTPVLKTLPPGKKVLLGWLETLDPSKASQYGSKDAFGFGDPQATPDPDAVYLLPYEHGVKHGVTQGYFGKYTHQNCYCLDFDLKEGSRICAARAGTVVRVKQDSDIGGYGLEFKKDANLIRILHADGTWADYAHLMKNGAKVKPGDRVAAGQFIGLSGHTGDAKGPHLHFEVDRADWSGEMTTSLPTKFLTQKGEAISLAEGKFYYSFHPGGAPFKEVYADMYTDALLDNYMVPIPHNGSVTIRTYTLDEKTMVYGLNGTGRDGTLILQFPSLNNLSSSKPLPYSKMIPAGKEVFLLSLRALDPMEKSSFSCRYDWR
jgi:murein DD-endopeptidase MepM/ murein hydrolase activator NlpD